MPDNTLTPEFRVSYANVFKTRRNDLSGKDEYSLVALFPKGADLTSLKQAMLDAIVEQWGADKAKWPKNMRNPLRDQAEREKDGSLPAGHEAGAFFCNLKSNQRPGLVDAGLKTIIDETEFYSGCFARAQVRAYAYDQKGNRGVAFGLQNLQKLRDGDPLSGRQKAEDAFEAVAGAGQAADANDPFGS